MIGPLLIAATMATSPSDTVEMKYIVLEFESELSSEDSLALTDFQHQVDTSWIEQDYSGEGFHNYYFATQAQDTVLEFMVMPFGEGDTAKLISLMYRDEQEK